MHNTFDKVEKDSARTFRTQGTKKYSVSLLHDDIISPMYFGYKSEVTY